MTGAECSGCKGEGLWATSGWSVGSMLSSREAFTLGKYAYISALRNTVTPYWWL